MLGTDFFIMAIRHLLLGFIWHTGNLVIISYLTYQRNVQYYFEIMDPVKSTLNAQKERV